MPGKEPKFMSPDDRISALGMTAKIAREGANEGAHIIDENGRLDVTENTDTIDKAHKEMEDEMAFRKLSTIFTPDQIIAILVAINATEYDNGRQGRRLATANTLFGSRIDFEAVAKDLKVLFEMAARHLSRTSKKD
jgi:hypothetical protein